MPRTLDQLSPTERDDLIRTVRGQVPGVPNPKTANLARRFDITESSVEAMRTAATSPPKKAVTESAPAPKKSITETALETDPYTGHKAALAVKLQMEAEAADAKPISECSIQELEALTAFAVSGPGFFGA